MSFAFRCGKCGQLFVPEDKEVCGEFDFKDQQIRYICRTKECGHENVFDIGGWVKKQERSPLPLPSMGNY